MPWWILPKTPANETDALLCSSSGSCGEVKKRRTQPHLRSKPRLRALFIITILFWLAFTYLLYVFSGHASSSAPHQHGEVGAIQWAKCEGNEDLECGIAIVPLDYRNISAGTARIALARANATQTPRLGTLLWNSGGPGLAPLTFFSNVARRLQNATSAQYDFVTFDPRGTGKSEPKLNCFTRAEFAALTSKTSIATDVDVDIARLRTPETKESLHRQYTLTQATWKTAWARCVERSGEQLKWVGSTSVARDFAFIAGLLDGEDAPINFYGGSYGTLLGQYIANMFPERVGRMYLAEVLEGTVWSHVPAHRFHRTFLEDVDEIYTGFTTQCAEAGPSACALARVEESGPALKARLEQFISYLYEHPLSVPGGTTPGILSSSHLRAFLFSSFMAPASWPSAAEAIAAAMRGDGTAILSALSDGGTDNDETDPLANPIVICLDGPEVVPTTIDELVDESIRVFANVSIFKGSDSNGCEFLPARLRTAERFTGPFNATTRNVVVFQNSRLDPADPHSGAKRVSDLMGNSARFVTLDTMGHNPLPSACIAQIKRSFFETGALPPDGTVCDVDEKAFPAF